MLLRNLRNKYKDDEFLKIPFPTGRGKLKRFYACLERSVNTLHGNRNKVEYLIVYFPHI